MKYGKLNTWQEFEKSDPWLYLLWDCRFDKNNLQINKIFVKRDLSEVSKSSVILKNYQYSEMQLLLTSIGFDNIEIYENWSSDNDLLGDEFIVTGEKNA